MRRENFTFVGANGQDVFTWCWNTADIPLGIIQIFHGMAEHAERYNDFAVYMNTEGFAVYACDQRGHGRTGELNHSSNHVGNEGFDGIVEDQKLLSKLIWDKYPDIPLYILGHSFGSFVAQEYIKHNSSDISGVILSGSCMMKGTEVKAGYVAAMLSLIFGRGRPNKLLDKLSFGSYNKAIENTVCKFSWLSRDEDQVKKYETDNFCGNIMSTNFFYCFFKGLNRLYDFNCTDKIPKTLPIYIMSGESDPVGKYGVGVKKLHAWYKTLGIIDLQFKLYQDGRHEMLNELNREEVYRDISAWLQKLGSSK